MLAYSLPLVPDAILVYIIGFSDQVFLASMQDTAVSAIYSIAYRVPTLIALVASIFVDAWQISMVNNNTKEEQITFFSNVGNTYSSIVFIIASGGVMCAKLAMTVLAQLLYRLDVHPDSGGRRGLQLPVQLPEKRVPAGKEDGRVLPVHGVLRGY